VHVCVRVSLYKDVSYIPHKESAIASVCDIFDILLDCIDDCVL
jgi:hypothetical protein